MSAWEDLYDSFDELMMFLGLLIAATGSLEVGLALVLMGACWSWAKGEITPQDIFGGHPPQERDIHGLFLPFLTPSRSRCRRYGRLCRHAAASGRCPKKRLKKDARTRTSF